MGGRMIVPAIILPTEAVSGTPMKGRLTVEDRDAMLEGFAGGQSVRGILR